MTYLKLARAAIDFDLTVIPEDAKIQSAKFAIYKYGHYDGYVKADKYVIYAVTSTWAGNGANWIKSTSSTNWKKPGGDYAVSAPLDTVDYNGSFNGWFEFTVTSAVQSFIDNPSTNFGFIVLVPGGVDSVADGLTKDQESYFHSFEATTAAMRPKLTITIDGTQIQQSSTGKDFDRIIIGAYNHSIRINVPLGETYQISISTIAGKTLSKFSATHSRQIYAVPGLLSQGIAVISITRPGATISKSIMIIK